MATPSNRPTRSKKRTPISQRNKLKAEQKDGFKRRFVNEDPDRIQMFLDAGWTLVTDGSKAGDSQVGEARRLGSATGKPVGGGKTAVLMEIPEEYYQEDAAAKEKKIKATEAGLLNNESGRQPTEGVYGEGIKIKGARPTIQAE